MDRIAAQILRQELLADAELLESAVASARQRIEESFPGSLPACGYELNRSYNILEKGFERVCEAFENHFDKRGDYHERLIERMSLELPGIRPRFLPASYLRAIRELKGFRHIFRHAYDLTLYPDRLRELVDSLEQVSARYRGWIDEFFAAIEPELEGYEPPQEA